MIVSREVEFMAAKPTGRKLRKIPSQYRLAKKLVYVLTKAFYFQQFIDSGKCRDTSDISAKFNIDRATVNQMLKLNWLAPQIKHAILDGREPKGMSWRMLKKPFPMIWGEQLKYFGFQEASCGKGMKRLS